LKTVNALLIVFTAADNVRCREWSAVAAFFIARLPLKTGRSFASLSEAEVCRTSSWNILSSSSSGVVCPDEDAEAYLSKSDELELLSEDMLLNDEPRWRAISVGAHE
jgi:hypothetical protein